MAYHFTHSLSIPVLNRIKQHLHAQSTNDSEDEDVDQLEDEPAQGEYDEDLDVEVRMDIEATEYNANGILAALNTDFEAGDIVGKLMAFIAQICSCSEDTPEYLMELLTTNGCPRLEIKLWVWTCWGSLSDCLAVTLSVQKVWTNIMCVMY